MSVIYIQGHEATKADPFTGNYTIAPNGCWEWNKRPDIHGYGDLDWRGKRYKAHRFSYEKHFGPIPDGARICHKCDNPKCVNPDHLFAGTQKENIRDCVEKGRNCRGEKQGRSKLKEADVLFIREQCKNRTTSHKDLAKLFNVHPFHISAIHRRVFWKHI